MYKVFDISNKEKQRYKIYKTKNKQTTTLENSVGLYAERYKAIKHL